MLEQVLEHSSRELQIMESAANALKIRAIGAKFKSLNSL